MNPFKPVIAGLELLAENVQVWPRAHIQERLDKIRRQLVKAIKQSKKERALTK